jgi:hypothetical protein
MLTLRVPGTRQPPREGPGRGRGIPTTVDHCTLASRQVDCAAASSTRPSVTARSAFVPLDFILMALLASIYNFQVYLPPHLVGVESQNGRPARPTWVDG